MFGSSRQKGVKSTAMGSRRPKYVKDKDGKFAGSIGEGKDALPTAADRVPELPASNDSPTDSGPEQLDAAWSAYDARRDNAIISTLETDTAGWIEMVREGGEPVARNIELSEAEYVQFYPLSKIGSDSQATGWMYRIRPALGSFSGWSNVEELPPIERAYFLSKQAHEGQRDKLGVPYLLHPRGVADYLETLDEYDALTPEQKEDAKVAAYLHDVLEDTPFTETDLRNMKFSDDAIKAVVAVTAPDGMPKEEYYERVKAAGPIAVAVKLADLGHNNLKCRRATLPGAPGTPVPEGGVDQYTKLGKKYVKAYRAFGAEIPEHLREFDTDAAATPSALGSRPPLPEWERSQNPHHRL